MNKFQPTTWGWSVSG